ncbi:Sodium-dependent phosphate transporter [Lachnospiraceae bacterium TWA4]|nr:Sodium-dependent phosphate transporter [Lachnospiraceae bacterium TWA4]
MDIFGVLTMMGGLSMFLYGMKTMGDGLEKLSGGRLEHILEKLTSKRIMAVLLGVLVTGAIQSSSATTVMVVGFVNSGIMKLSQAVGIIMGANIGTTVTSWMLSLTGIESSNVFLRMLKPSSFAPILSLIGIILLMGAKNNKKKDIGVILLGFTILMFGMETMSGAVKPLADNEAFTGILTRFSNPILGVIAGLVLTAVIQSSSASVGILQALCTTGAVSFGMAIPIIMGQNIGTCVTAMLSSVGSSKNAKRASMIHLYFNLIGTFIFLIGFYSINQMIGGFLFLNNYATPSGIAIIHSLFNIGAVLLLYPFADKLVYLAEITVREHKENQENPENSNEWSKLDNRFLEYPDYALEVSQEVAEHMALKSQNAILLAIKNRKQYSENIISKVLQLENEIDQYEDKIGTYLMKMSGKPLSDHGKKTMAVLEHCISNFERISDHAVNLIEVVTAVNQKNLQFSKEALSEISIYEDAVCDIIKMTVQAFIHNDAELAKDIEPLEQVIDELNSTIKRHHLKRLRKGKCMIEMGVYIEDLLTNMERISDHCSNIGVGLIRIQDDAFDAHEYLDDIKDRPDERFQNKYIEYKKKYELLDVKGTV